MKYIYTHLRLAWTAFLCFWLFLCGSASAAAEGTVKNVRPRDLEAVYLINFCRFATWPDVSFSSPDAPIVIGVWGDKSFSETVQRAAQEERVGRRPIEVRQIDSETAADHVHLLFVSNNIERRLEQWPQDKRQGMLVVGDSSAILRDGGHIQFIKEGHRIKLRINPASIKASGLIISSTLLRIADIVPEP